MIATQRRVKKVLVLVVANWGFCLADNRVGKAKNRWCWKSCSARLRGTVPSK